jgi:hypothetical protein
MVHNVMVLYVLLWQQPVWKVLKASQKSLESLKVGIPLTNK